MTTDELKKEAEESFEKYRVTDIDYVVSPYSEDEGEKRLMFNNEYDAEEEYFRLYSKGYLASAEPREKRIAELEARCNELFLQTCEQAEKIKELKDYRLTTVAKQQTDMSKYALNLEHKLSWYDDQLTKAKELLNELNNQNAKYNKQIAELETRCNELFLQTCEQAEKISELEKENTELKEELKKWKDEWQEQVQKATDEGYARTLQTIQLTKAKELLKWALHVDVEHTDSAEFEKKWAEAEQFLSEVKNEKHQRKEM